jgi:hypothetical protein
MKWVKGIGIALVVIFALFYMITRPEAAASAVEGAFNAVISATQAMGQFFTSLVT